jgi:outer membrane immunogenic protein
MKFMKSHERDHLMLRRIVVAASTAVVLATAANAADIYRAPSPAVSYKDTPPPYAGVNWSGLYVGINGGGAWNDRHSSDLVDPTGGFGGGQIGYNFQRGNIVFGIESDFQGAGISDKDAFGNKSDLNWFGTVRGRLGYAFGPALLYGTGGFAYGNVKNTAPGFFSASETQTGWVAGGGLEYKLAPAWSIKSEYQFLSLDASDPNGAGPLGIGLGDRTEVHTARVGVNYFFGGGYEPLK